MAKAVKLPLPRRIQQALADMFEEGSPFYIEDPDNQHLPPHIKKNSDRVDYLTKFRACANYMLSTIIYSWAESKKEQCKDELVKQLKINVDAPPSTKDTYVFGPIAIGLRVDNGQQRIDKATLITTLMVDYKFTLDDANAAIAKSMKRGKNPMHLSPTPVIPI